MTTKHLFWIIPLLATASACQSLTGPKDTTLPVKSIGSDETVAEVTPVVIVTAEATATDQQIMKYLNQSVGSLAQCHLAVELRSWGICPFCERCVPELQGNIDTDCTFPPQPPSPKRVFQLFRLPQCTRGMQGGVILHQSDAVAGTEDIVQPPQ